MSMDIKLSQAQISKIIQSGGLLGFCLGKLGKKVVTDFSIAFAKNNLSGLVRNLASNAASNAINTFERRIRGKGALIAWTGYTFCILNEDVDDTIKIVKSLGDLGVLGDEVTEAVKHEIKKQEGRFLGAKLAP